MDPITGISLIASLITVTEAGVKSALKFHELYEHGCLSENADFEKTTNDLTSITNDLRRSMSRSTTSRPLSKEEAQLVEIAEDCERVASQLLLELSKVRFHGSQKPSFLWAALKSSKAMWRKKTVDSLRERLEAHERTLETSLLYNLGRRFDVSELRGEEQYSKLDGRLQHIVQCLIDSQTNVEVLVKQEHKTTRQTVTDLRQTQLDIEVYERYKESLFFQDIYARQEQIAEPYRDTYEWIFEEMSGGGHSRPWDNFKQWLEHDSGIYWINGKAGSGKSTLMNYVCCDPRTQEILRQWARGAQLSVPTFFFWNAGNSMQKSVGGLLRSLLYQLLDGSPKLMDILNPKEKRVHAWTETRLRNTLWKVLEQNLIPLKVCFFVDGLDEYEGPQDVLIDLVKRLPANKDLKMCISSRPLLSLQEAFGQCPKLRLQDFTQAGIEAFVNGQLWEQPRFQQLQESDDYYANILVKDVVSKAAGVFLWATIVVRHLREGLRNMDSYEKLREDISTLPSEIEDLYSTLLHQRIPRRYHHDAARYFQIAVLSDDNLGTLAFYLVDKNRVVEDTPFKYEVESLQNLVAGCKELQTRVPSITAGLLEVTGGKSYAIFEKSNHLGDISWGMEKTFFYTGFTFLHRTARDFLIFSDKSGNFLDDDLQSLAKIKLSLARGLLAHTYYGAFCDMTFVSMNLAAAALSNVFKHIKVSEDLSGIAQTRLIDSIDYEDLASRYFQKETGEAPDLSKGMPGTEEPWWCNKYGNRIDLVGLAANVGMSIYVGQKLGLNTRIDGDAPNVNHNPSKPEPSGTAILDQISLAQHPPAEGKTTLELSSEGSSPCRMTPLKNLNYRTAIQSWLGICQSQIDLHSTIVESYNLFCAVNALQPSSEMVDALLAAGADPNLKFKFKGSNQTSIDKALDTWSMLAFIYPSEPLTKHLAGIVSVLLQYGAVVPEKYISLVRDKIK